LHGLFGGIVYMGGETTSYSTVDVLSSKYLYIDPLPKDEYVTVYRTTQGLPLNQNEFSLFSEKYAPKLSAALGESVPKYTFESMGHYISAEEDDHPLSMQQYKSFHAIRYWNYDLDNSGKNNMVFDGITVVIDQSKSDSQIKKSLQPLKEKLEKIFDTKFVNLDIYRYYDDYSEAGAVSVLVVFSNSDDETIKKSVKLEFDNRSHHESDIVSKNKLYKINFTYWEERGENVRDDVAVVRIKKLPLKKAEQYLSKGYVLSLQGCAICQSLQEPVDFTDYDYVEIVQRTANRENDDGTYDIIPFYAFYKYIGKGKNGNEIYAKTYVPAIEVSGWEKYFKNKHKNHNTSSQNSSSQVMSEPSVSSENTVSIVSQITSQTSSEASSAAEITQ